MNILKQVKNGHNINFKLKTGYYISLTRIMLYKINNDLWMKTIYQDLIPVIDSIEDKLNGTYGTFILL